MNYFLDTEFSDLPWKPNVELISVALVREDGASYFACSSEFDERNVSEFVTGNVLQHLPPISERKALGSIKSSMLEFFAELPVEKVWSVFPTVAQLQSFGFDEDKALDLLDRYGDFDYQLFRKILSDDYSETWPNQGSNLTPIVIELIDRDYDMPRNMNEHDALSDAIWARDVWMKAENEFL